MHRSAAQRHTGRCAVLCLFVRTHQNNTRYVTGTRYVNITRACGVGVVYLQHGALGICESRLFTSQTSGLSICYLLRSVFLVSERSGRNRPLREAPCIYIYVTTEQNLSSLPLSLSLSLSLCGDRLIFLRHVSIRLGLQSHFGDRTLKSQVVCPRNGTAVLTVQKGQ